MSGTPAAAAIQRLRLAALCVGVGLAIEIATLGWAHPTAFLAFAGLGGGLVALGVGIYLWTILKASPAAEPESS